MNRRLLPAALCVALLCADRPLTAETAETILIRQTLEKDRFGRRRGDAELALSACDEERFVVYDGAGSIDMAGWGVRHGTRAAYSAALQAELETRLYDVERAVTLMVVWDDKAFATTLDTGLVIDRASGTSSRYEGQRLWTFRKVDEEWLATGMVESVGDTADGPARGTVASQEVADALRQEASAWSAGRAGGIAGSMDEEVVVLDAYGSSDPAKWLIIFADREEFDGWLQDRLDHVRYDVQRTVVHAVTDGEGREAVAVTRDRITATYAGGDARVVQDRVSAWLLTRASGDWQATWVFWKMKPFTAAEPTASLP